jgi:hypothetical protein
MKKQFKFTLMFTFISLSCAAFTNAQVASNPPYALDQAVIANGGSTSADAGNIYTVEGTIGQAIAGTTSSNSPFSVKGGFWTANALAPTAATVSISGRILTADGNGLRNARVTLTDMSGNARTVLSGKLGNFRFTDVQAGETYIVSVASRRYIFQPQVVTPTEDITELSFSGFSQSSGEGLDGLQ